MTGNKQNWIACAGSKVNVILQDISFFTSSFAAGNTLSISFHPIGSETSGDSFATLILKYDMSKGV